MARNVTVSRLATRVDLRRCRMRELARQRPTHFQLDVAVGFTRESSGQLPRLPAVVASLPQDSVAPSYHGRRTAPDTAEKTCRSHPPIREKSLGKWGGGAWFALFAVGFTVVTNAKKHSNQRTNM